MRDTSSRPRSLPVRGRLRRCAPYRPAKRSAREIDESTDTYDTIDWLVKHAPRNNERVGLYGISYLGFYSTMGLIDTHPALKAVSPQGRGGVLTRTVALSAYADAGGSVPLEWVILGAWLALGPVFWRAAARLRGRISVAHRRQIILGTATPGTE